MNPKKYIFITIFLAAVFVFVILEIGLRCYTYVRYSTNTVRFVPHSRLIYEHRPSITFVNKEGIKITYNSLGFIGDEISPKGNNVFRILSIGDSIASGEYLQKNQRYINMMGDILSKHTTKKIDIVNAGVIGYNSWQEAELLKTKGLSVKPDLIIVSLCFNDDRGWRPEIRKTWFGGIREIPRHHKKARHLNFLYQRSQLFQFIYDRMYFLKKSLKKQKRYYEEHEWKSEMKKWREPLEEIISLAKDHNIEILFVVFPLEQQILKKEDNSSKPLADFFKERNIYFLDMIKAFNRNSDKKLYIERDSIHPNATGSAIAAEAMANYIIEKKIPFFSGKNGL
ncbi:MAG: SGNH/GDSL hydrolase family protein [Candidatus Omnitrophica bacterium]|nr:SGNH/GDSL hydrolase family protein [Candidatus Omnitrophota bacterium]